MTLDQACVLAKEITIGEQMPCIVQAEIGNASSVFIKTDGADKVVLVRVIAMAKRRGYDAIPRPGKVQFH